MPRVVKPLTDKQVSNAKPSEKAYTLPDGCHSSSLCLYAMRILRDEITAKNRDSILAMTLNEIRKLNTILSKNDNEETLTHKEAKETFKRIGLKPRHIKA
ncbi:MAG: hypothetical protein EOM50_23870 [Erysipelotrichia bacterium]|nr:hypothetical protein [Erysipelotrichia bacterium]